ncbi:hypothetical protein E2C01_094896 [Portunus trituberculatus]|uniref:Uncharacterized protein n=1 Tax=Portunus trituberculatus TaxID=210409 RepID=A0A5B7JRP6_PORTR|nr:hypothetical protein [Portunus trituberculatus]
MWQDVSSIIEEVAKQELGTKWVGGSKKKHSPWWSEDLRSLVRDKTKKLKSMVEEKNSRNKKGICGSKRKSK